MWYLWHLFVRSRSSPGLYCLFLLDPFLRLCHNYVHFVSHLTTILNYRYYFNKKSTQSWKYCIWNLFMRCFICAAIIYSSNNTIMSLYLKLSENSQNPVGIICVTYYTYDKLVTCPCGNTFIFDQKVDKKMQITVFLPWTKETFVPYQILVTVCDHLNQM